MARLTETHAINFHTSPCTTGFVQSLDPGRYPVEKLGLPRDNKNGVLSSDRLQLDDILSEATLPRINDPFELRDDRLGCAVGDRIDADGLAAHPIGIKAEYGLNGRTAVGRVALDYKQVATRLRAYHAWLGSEVFKELD